MARAKAQKTMKLFIVRVKANPNFCGIGAGGTQFANGEATGVSERMATWFKAHKGYEVIAMDIDEPAEAAE